MKFIAGLFLTISILSSSELLAPPALSTCELIRKWYQIEFYVKKSTRSLSDLHRRAIWHYTGHADIAVNGYLERIKGNIQKLSHSIPYSNQVFNNTNIDSWYPNENHERALTAFVFDLDEAIMSSPRVPKGVYLRGEKRGESLLAEIGDRVKIHRYLSVTYDLRPLEGEANFFAKDGVYSVVKVPDGVRGVLGDLGEKEFILQRGLELELVDIEKVAVAGKIRTYHYYSVVGGY